MPDKEMPKKVFKTYFKFREETCLDYGNCPICGEELTPHDRYCSGCGNKLDWGDTNV